MQDHKLYHFAVLYYSLPSGKLVPDQRSAVCGKANQFSLDGYCWKSEGLKEGKQSLCFESIGKYGSPCYKTIFAKKQMILSVWPRNLSMWQTRIVYQSSIVLLSSIPVLIFEEYVHSPDGMTEWNWNSHLRLMHWLYNSSQKCCKTESTLIKHVNLGKLIYEMQTQHASGTVCFNYFCQSVLSTSQRLSPDCSSAYLPCSPLGASSSAYSSTGVTIQLQVPELIGPRQPISGQLLVI